MFSVLSFLSCQGGDFFWRWWIKFFDGLTNRETKFLCMECPGSEINWNLKEIGMFWSFFLRIHLFNQNSLPLYIWTNSTLNKQDIDVCCVVCYFIITADNNILLIFHVTAHLIFVCHHQQLTETLRLQKETNIKKNNKNCIARCDRKVNWVTLNTFLIVNHCFFRLI